MKKINIVIADDHKIFRQGVTELLKREKDIVVVADLVTKDELDRIIEKNIVDLVIMDIDMGEESGIDITRQLKKDHPEVRVLALSMHGDRNYVVRMLEAGASGYILKNAGKDEILDAIHTVASGNTYFSSQVSNALLEHISNPVLIKKKKPEDLPLTDREIEVLKLIAEENNNAEIAEKLFISVRTVDTHRRNLLDKLAAKNTAGLVKYAVKKGLVDDH